MRESARATPWRAPQGALPVTGARAGHTPAGRSRSRIHLHQTDMPRHASKKEARLAPGFLVHPDFTSKRWFNPQANYMPSPGS
jgi:hypothetical protein